MALEIKPFEKTFVGHPLFGPPIEVVFVMFGLYDEDGKRHAYSWKRAPMEALKKEIEEFDPYAD